MSYQIDTLVFDESQITSPINGNKPTWGGLCHSLTGEEGRTVVITRTYWNGEEVSLTLTSRNAGGGQRMPDKYNFQAVIEPVCMSDRKGHNGITEDGTATTLNAQEKERPIVSEATHSVVRRLTPMECERLQGFPDGWTNIGEWIDSKGKKHKDADSPRYKALGNSIALPFWEWLARRIAAQYEKPLTMGSLFDGIGGFPLAFAKCGGKPVWASEIEEFPIAVVKKHFGDDADGTKGDWREYDVPLP